MIVQKQRLLLIVLKELLGGLLGRIHSHHAQMD